MLILLRLMESTVKEKSIAYVIYSGIASSGKENKALKKLNTKLIFLSCLITTFVLFGGWFGTQFFGQEKPIRDWIAKQEGITINDLRLEQEAIFLDITFTNKELFAQSYIETMTNLKKLSKGKEIMIQISSEQGENHPFWLKHSAPIMEALATKHFTQVDQVLSEWQTKGIIKQGKSMMNSQYLFVYLELLDGEQVYVAFSLESGKEEVTHD